MYTLKSELIITEKYEASVLTLYLDEDVRFARPDEIVRVQVRV